MKHDRDTAIEINDTVKDLKEHGIIWDTANAIIGITNTTRETKQLAKDAAIEAAEKAPATINTR